MKDLLRDDLEYKEIPSKPKLYFRICILFCVWTSISDLPTLKIFVQIFFWQNCGSKIPYLPTVWTYVQTFVVFFLPFPYKYVKLINRLKGNLLASENPSS